MSTVLATLMYVHATKCILRHAACIKPNIYMYVCTYLINIGSSMFNYTQKLIYIHIYVYKGMVLKHFYKKGKNLALH